MKHLLILALALVSVCSFAQPFIDGPVEPPKPPDQWGHTWSTTLTLDAGQSADLYALLPESCSGGWARITGKCQVNGMETTFVSWARPGKCVAVAVEACTIEVWGK